MAKLTRETKKQLAEKVRPKIPELARNIGLLFAYAPLTANIGGEARILDQMSIEHILLRLLEEWAETESPVLILDKFFVQAIYDDGWEIRVGYALESSAKLS